MRVLAIDLGGKRTGAAVADTELGVAAPAGVVQEPMDPGERLLDGLQRLIDEHGPDALVVGLPLNMDGTEGPASKGVRAFAARIGERTGLPVHFQDERATSERANELMARSGLTHKQKKARRDALAAGVILQAWLDAGEADGSRPAE